jgi:hypothetical protein
VFDPQSGGHTASDLATLDLDGSLDNVVSFAAFGADLFGLAVGPDGDAPYSVGGNGAGQLRRVVLDPPSFTTIGGDDLGNINDLVFVGDNLWGLDSIAQDFSHLLRIDAATGEVLESVSIDVLPGQSLFSGLAVAPPCPADIDGTGDVGIGDFLALLEAWGPNPGHPADLDGNGVVGIEDCLALLAAWGPCP